MASISMALPWAVAATKNRQTLPGSGAFFNPLRLGKLIPVRVTKAQSKLRIEASLKEAAAGKIAAVAVAASMAVPEVAQAAETLTPSLKNFLLSIAAGGVVLVVIAGAVVGVSNFDPVKRS
ncbi:photosystem II reaction center X protein [Striga asiatica]|uniref:Photosystem II reaction center X protein n=1 Tax=Striga asiatica TaxID=4170 RepID=A0A5A7R2N7_STRAF|nr:photosystem II reaction center X protein [Striga asiatica]